MDAPALDVQEVGSAFRAAMRGITSTVTIVTATDGERRHGMTMTAVSSLSMEPPSMIACVNRSSYLHDIMLGATRFCVNVLHSDQTGISSAFSGRLPSAERFRNGVWDRDPASTDYLLDAQANIFCERIGAIPFGTHTIFIGAVKSVLLRDDTTPLLYRNAGYC